MTETAELKILLPIIAAAVARLAGCSNFERGSL